MSDTQYIVVIIYTLYNYYLSANKKCPSFKIFRLSLKIFKKRGNTNSNNLIHLFVM